MPYAKRARKTGKKQWAMVRRGFKSRYQSRYKGKRAYNIGQIMSDVGSIKRQLNVEHKHIDYTFGSAGNISVQKPTKNNPIIIAINTPIRGTGFSDRVGNQIRVTHMTCKYQLSYHNNTDLIQRQNVRARIIFARDAGNVPSIFNLLETDANGHYTDLSFTNTQEYRKYVWMKALDMRHGYTQPTNRFPLSNTAGTTANPNTDGSGGIGGSSGSGSIDVDDVSNRALNVASFFKRKETKCSIRMMFENGTDNVETMKPYLVLTSDVIDNSNGDDYDFISVTGAIRMTYVDN